MKDLIRCMELCVLRYSITVFQINPVFRELSMLLLLLLPHDHLVRFWRITVNSLIM